MTSEGDRQDSVPDVDPSGTVISEGTVVPGSGVVPASGVVPGSAVVPRADPADAVARLAGQDLAPAERRRALGELAASLRARGFKDFMRPKAAMAWVADTVIDVAPRIPVRTVETLRQQHPDMDDMQIATRLVRTAARSSAGIGVVGGGVASVQWAAAPTLVTAPVLLAAETVAVVAVELKLIAELQELYGQPLQGSSAQRAVTLLQAWAARRGVDLLVPGRSIAAVLGTAARQELQNRLVRRFGRNLTTLGPLLTGAAVAAYLNRRATLRLAEEVRKDLHRRRLGQERSSD